ncbi:MAG: hypothetical protein GKR90_25135 [Pseudomonadales bacterium]|nr:hypothetical protein [Pseudomonadales bacterium]
MIDHDALEKEGFCIVDGVLTRARATEVKEKLWAAAAESERRGSPTFIRGLDPNEANVRVFNLLDLDPVFVDLIQHPTALDAVQTTLGEQFLISNFTANIARPGAKSMVPHSDLAVVFPGPWLHRWSMNVIWCLDDVHEANGATRYLPGSHRLQNQSDLPEDFQHHMQPFETSAGDVIVMEGRLWHTSGENTTTNEDRALLFGYYTAPFLRPQVNWNVLLSDQTKDGLSAQMTQWLGLGAAANIVNAEFVARPAQS